MTKLVIDLSNKSAEIRDTTGHTKWIWSNVTRTTALPLAHAAGWIPAGPWQLTSPPDGFWCPLRPCHEILLRQP
jgi:hypothetical protein